MKNIIRKISMVLLFTVILTTVNCFATVNYVETKITKEGTDYICRTYELQQDDSNFISSVEKEFEIDKKKYLLDSINKSGGNITDNINIQTTKNVVTKTNSTSDILNALPQNIEYNQDEYVGEYKLDISSLQTKSIYNGYKEYLVEETKQYFDLNKNDLSYIPKQIKKDNITLGLITTDWYVQTTRNIGDNEVADKYRAECYYAGKKRVDNPLTYTTTANYIGTATKVVYNPFIYEIEYKCITKDINYIPYILGASSGVIFFVVVIFFKKKSKKDKEVQK